MSLLFPLVGQSVGWLTPRHLRSYAQCFDPEDFRYFLDLYDREMQAHAKLNVMLEEIKNQGGEAAFHKFYFNTKEKIVQALSSSEAFAKFAQDDSFLAHAEQEVRHLTPLCRAPPD